MFVTAIVNGSMVYGAQRNRPLVTDLAARGARLGEANVMGVARDAATDQAWLGGDEPEVVLVADPTGLCYW